MHRRKTQARLRIQGNFYPMTTAAFIEDTSSRMTLLSAQSHGVASLQQGIVCCSLQIRNRIELQENHGIMITVNTMILGAMIWSLRVTAMICGEICSELALWMCLKCQCCFLPGLSQFITSHILACSANLPTGLYILPSVISSSFFIYYEQSYLSICWTDFHNLCTI